ncbi:unnamed protein product [Lactuca saligna]|uniref:Uncharacterized protein n=1 Tax=Lactuca saligna TaxID=75948 RepID=A0AA36EBJ0_LACSI|nr:unnamed protein product [Lactuca saligna]CAI9290351.1 unnamed protein product [Lactuca saligna]
MKDDRSSPLPSIFQITTLTSPSLFFTVQSQNPFTTTALYEASRNATPTPLSSTSSQRPFISPKYIPPLTASSSTSIKLRATGVIERESFTVSVIKIRAAGVVEREFTTARSPPLKVTGKALMVDKIINYVMSLQGQLEQFQFQAPSQLILGTHFLSADPPPLFLDQRQRPSQELDASNEKPT